MAGISLDTLRNGKKYRLTNHGEHFDFVIEHIIGNGDFKVKDLHTLERYHLRELFSLGKGRDFEIRELEQNLR